MSHLPLPNCHTIVTIVVWIHLLISSVGSISIDNGVVGEPEVQCGVDSVELQFRTQKTFTGKVFVKGHYNENDCKVDYSNAAGIEKPTGGIIVRHGSCDMQRQRMISPQGMQFTTVVVISFHPVFITKIDKAYSIKCMYRELEKTVTAGLEVSMLSTAVITYTIPMPVCTYTIRKDEIDGEVLKYAKVGDQVVHRWECQTDTYGILVHTCYVEDGQGEKVLVVDEKGCHTDRFLLGDPTYVEALNLAYRESHVFKFADRVAVRFQCQIRLCLKVDGGCQGVTPPICASAYKPGGLASRLNTTSSGTSSSSSASTSTSTITTTTITGSTTTSTSTTSRIPRRFQRDAKPSKLHLQNKDFEPVDGDFQSQYMYVLESTENPEKGSKSDQDAWQKFLGRSSGSIVSELRDSVCLSSSTFIILMGAVTVVFISATFACIAICCQKMKRNSGNKKSMPNDSSCYSTVSSLWKNF